MKTRYTATAAKQLRKMDRAIAAKIVTKIEQYAVDPASLANSVKALTGVHALRLRVGDYRVIFTADGLILTILKIGHRREIYE